MTEGNYSNVGHRGPVYKGLGAMNPCDLSMDNPTQSAEVIAYTGPEGDYRPYSFNVTVRPEPDIYNFQVRHPRCV
jgi:hypothetical protein